MQNAIVCLPLFPGELDGTSRDNDFDKETSALHENAMYDYFSRQNLTRQQFLDRNSKWPSSVLNIIHTYLGIMSYCEAFDGNENMTCYQKNQNPPWGSDYLEATRMILEKQLHKLSVSIDEIRQKFGLEVASQYSFRVRYRQLSDNGTFIPTNVDIIRTMFVGDRQICYQLGLEKFHLTPKSDFVFLAVEKNLPRVSMKYLQLGMC